MNAQTPIVEAGPSDRPVNMSRIDAFAAAVRRREMIWTIGKATLAGGVGLGALCFGASFLLQKARLEVVEVPTVYTDTKIVEVPTVYTDTKVVEVPTVYTDTKVVEKVVEVPKVVEKVVEVPTPSKVAEAPKPAPKVAEEPKPVLDDYFTRCQQLGYTVRDCTSHFADDPARLPPQLEPKVAEAPKPVETPKARVVKPAGVDEYLTRCEQLGYPPLYCFTRYTDDPEHLPLSAPPTPKVAPPDRTSVIDPCYGVDFSSRVIINGATYSCPDGTLLEPQKVTPLEPKVAEAPPTDSPKPGDPFYTIKDGDPFYTQFILWCTEYGYRPVLCSHVPHPQAWSGDPLSPDLCKEIAPFVPNEHHYSCFANQSAPTPRVSPPTPAPTTETHPWDTLTGKKFVGRISDIVNGAVCYDHDTVEADCTHVIITDATGHAVLDHDGQMVVSTTEDLAPMRIWIGYDAYRAERPEDPAHLSDFWVADQHGALIKFAIAPKQPTADNVSKAVPSSGPNWGPRT